MKKSQQMDMAKAAFILKTIAHPARLSIIALLAKKGGMPVSKICEELNGEQSLFSHHLINMKTKGLLKSEKNGTSVYYSLKEKNLVSIIQCIQKCDCYF